MRKLFARIVRTLLRVPGMWPLFRVLLVIPAEIVKNQKVSLDKQPVEQRIRKTLGEPVVKHGPFAGMRYPGFAAAGSTVWPKFIGSYEKELHLAIEEILQQPITEVIDVGCAEGYYAVGLARSLPQAKVYAYDIDPRARELCSKMAVLNGVQDRVSVSGACTPETLQQFPFTGKGLIICDCEGYEKVLFNKANLSNLGNCDILIELHDCHDLSISGYITALFRDTHHLTLIPSVDDVFKAIRYQYPETDALDPVIRKEIFAESRHSAMEWAYLKAK
jgi:hypothetical protein